MTNLIVKEPETSALKAVLELAAKEPILTPETITKEEELINKELARIREIRRSLFQVEDQARIALSVRDNELDLRQIQFKKERKLVGKYRRVSLEPLKWRHPNGNPKLAVFSTECARFFISADPTRWNCSDLLPERIANCYSDVGERLRTRARNDRWRVSIFTLSFVLIPIAVGFSWIANAVIFLALLMLVRKMFDSDSLSVFDQSLEVRYEGVIPDHARAKIKAASQDFQHIFLLAEVEEKKWTVKVDPIAVGLANGQFWLIIDFDTTPVEEVIKREFVV
ncbi:MAG TPA: hypothetical protein VJB92_02930 [Candidatus Paceibacterota bacterium]